MEQMLQFLQNKNDIHIRATFPVNMNEPGDGICSV
jgi:hypothetical protein